MEKTNKYYGVIEKLVKEHKKFAGNEEFLEDIIDDVYSHSEVVINSIANNSVVDAYLAKVVGTSIITVPKRLGKRNETVQKEPEPIQEIFNKNNVNTELVDKMINSAPKAVEEIGDITPTNDEVVELLEQNEDVSCIEEFDIQTEEPEENEISNSDVMELELPEEESDVAEINDAGDELEEDFQDNLIDLQENIDSVDDVVDEIEDRQHDDLIDLEENTAENSVEEAEYIDEIENEVSPEVLETAEELEPVKEILDESLDYSEIVSETTDDTEDLLVPVELDETSDLLEVETPSDINFDDTVDLQSDEQNEFKPTDYSVFNYNPAENSEEIDEEEIANSIYDLERRKPDLNILKIYNLKYKENNSISEIASKLNMDEDEVKEAVSELISIV